MKDSTSKTMVNFKIIFVYNNKDLMQILGKEKRQCNCTFVSHLSIGFSDWIDKVDVHESWDMRYKCILEATRELK